MKVRMASGLFDRAAVPAVIALTMTFCVTSARAADTLKFAVGTMSYPMESFDSKGKMTGGLLMDLGDALARELGTQAEYVIQSRNRVELAVQSGEVHMSCYSNPNWWDKAKPVNWTVATIPQIERVVALKKNRIPTRIPADFEGLRVAVHLGYHFPAIQPLFDGGKATRVDEKQVPLMFKAVESGLADVLITSEGEIQGYFKTNPEKRKIFAISTEPYSVMPTQCALSMSAPWSLDRIDKAFNALIKRGELDKMTRKYGMSMR